MCYHSGAIKKRINTLTSLTICHSHPKNILQYVSTQYACNRTSLATNYLLLHLYHIFLSSLSNVPRMRLYHESNIIIEINRKPLSIFVHQGDLLLGNIFSYMTETESVPNIRENILITSPIWASWSVMVTFGELHACSWAISWNAKRIYLFAHLRVMHNQTK